MFSSIGNILGVKQRHAEQSDTRQDIQRHDPDHERRRKKKKEAEEELFSEQNGVDISINALQIFLNKFLKELSEKHPKAGFNATSKHPTIDAEKPPEQNIPPQTSVKAAKAASAYQHMAQSQDKSTLLGDVNESNADLISLDAAEIRIIHALLEDLKILAEKNIEYIHIERAENFLQSLVNAVDLLKSSKLFDT